MLLAAAAAFALLIDRLLGEPPARWHPVVWMGRGLGWAGARIAPRVPTARDFGSFWLSALVWCALAAIVVGASWGLQWAALQLPALPAALLLGVLLKPLLAWRMLEAEVGAVEAALAQSLAAGRARLAWLVSRDVAALDAAQVRESAIESLAENLNDSVVAPLFWFAVAGLPGAALYRFANTADAMWGYPGMHGVAPARIVIAASASEFIYRITAWAAHTLPPGARTVALPPHGYGDYAHAAQAWGLRVVHAVHEVGDAGDASVPGLHWACEPGSPLGQADAALVAWRMAATQGGMQRDVAVDRVVDGFGDRSVDGLVDGAMDGPREGVRERPRDEPCDEPSNDEPAGAPAPVRVLDCAYAPLRLSGQPSLDAAALDAVWRLYSPNKALGLTGVRAAYAIAPSGGQQRVAQMVAQLEALAPSWPLGAHGVALLAAWTQPAVHAWLQESLHTLRVWKARQIALLQAQGWQVLESEAPFFCARPPVADAADVPALCAQLRRHGVRLRDCSSFGLPGLVRLGVRAPASQDALLRALG